MTFLISYGFIIWAAFWNACMDAWENSPNFNESIFKHWDKNFWCKDVSWKYAKKVFGWKVDAWHFAKTFMVLGICAAGAFFKPHHQIWVHLVSMGVLWNITFVFFYHVIFKVK